MRVPDRWIPMLAATVGVLGGLAGALIGGHISNQGQEQQFENQRKAARDDLRQDSYANYLQAGFGYLLAVQLKHAGVKVTDNELKARAQALVGAQAAVALFGNPRFDKPTEKLLNDLVTEDDEMAADRLGEFRDMAKEDLGLPLTVSNTGDGS
jgi:hypothetical protein